MVLPLEPGLPLDTMPPSGGVRMAGDLEREDRIRKRVPVIRG